MKKVFIVHLTQTERAELEALVHKGRASALAIARARILLKADQGKDDKARPDVQIAEALGIADGKLPVRHEGVFDSEDAARSSCSIPRSSAILCETTFTCKKNWLAFPPPIVP